MMSKLMALPREVFYLVVSPEHLELKDIKNVSLCSKECRGLLLPVLFRGFHLSRQSLEFLGNSGETGRVAEKAVRTVVMRLSDTGFSLRIPWGFYNIVEDGQISLSQLARFQNLRSVEITVSLVCALSHQLLGLLFKSLASHPFAKTRLKRMVVNYRDYPDYAAAGVEYTRYLTLLSDEERLSLESGVRGEEVEEFVRREFRFEELVVKVDRFHFETTTREGLPPRFGERLLAGSAATVERLDIQGGFFTGYSSGRGVFFEGDTVFWNVKYLNMRIRGLDRAVFMEISYRFPAVEELRIRAQTESIGVVGDEIAYRDILRMGRLKRVFLMRQHGPKRRKMVRLELQKSVEFWIGLGRQGDSYSHPRLSRLESAEFGLEDSGGLTSVGCKILREYTPSSGVGDRYKPMASPAARDSEAFKELEFEWQSFNKPFWKRAEGDPGLRAQSGMPLSEVEHKADAHFAAPEGQPRPRKRFLLEYFTSLDLIV
ncbi:hypothetical protein TWF481_002437 [Arthrobotrys musiformis]|uniref:F-box domain-containing protein n=1 Tax=Arthrobotrys musiformis TaxID=47236 RepID=A0AAV9VTC3_9PEZI